MLPWFLHRLHAMQQMQPPVLGCMRRAADLVQLERPGTLILMNGRYPRPLVFRRGIEVVKAALGHPDEIRDATLRELLLRFRILVTEEEAIPQTHQRFEPEGKRDLGLYLLVTQQCNLGCVYCLGRNESYLNNSRMSEQTAKLAIEKAAQSMAPKGRLQVIYFGGEPLLNWNVVRECIRYVDEELRGKYDVEFKNHITTNLTVLPPDFLDVAAACGVSVLVDIDGTRDVHNRCRPFRSGRPSYDRIVRNVELLKARNIYFELRTTVISDNVEELRAIQEHHHGLKPEACAFPTLIPVDSEGHALDPKLYPDPRAFARELSGAIGDKRFDLSRVCPSNVIATRMLRGEFVVYGCGMILGNTGVVDHDGTVYPCIYFVGQEDFRLGNIADPGNALSQEGYRRFFETQAPRLHVDNVAECRNCPIRYLCGAGCSIRLLSLRGDDEWTNCARKYFLDISCAASWASVEAAIDYFGDSACHGGVTVQC
jgi:uncharacterized protein